MQHIYTVLLCSLCLLGISPLQSQNLEAGDIAFVSYRADAVDAFAFVALADIPANEVIFFTDKGWRTNSSFVNQEGIIQYTAPMIDIPCGTVITIALPTPATVTATLGSVAINGAFNLDENNGDQILAYQGIAANPTFIAAINNSGIAGEWQTMGINATNSTLPPGLIDGQTAISLVEIDNATYNDAVIMGLKSELLSAINNQGNWTGNDANTHPPYLTPLLTITDCNADDAIITHTGTAPAAQFIGPGNNDEVLYQVQVDVSDENVVLTELTFATDGNWIPIDIVNFKLRYSTDNVLDILDPTLDLIETGLTGGMQTLTFDDFQQMIPIGTAYLFITMDVSNDAIYCREISVQVDSDSDFTYSQVPTFAGSTFAPANILVLGSGVIVEANFVQTSVSVAEGNNTQNLLYQVDVVVANRPCGDLTVNVSSTAGTAGAGDFSAASIDLVFPTASEYPLTMQYFFTITGDNVPEDDETFELTLSVVSGYGVVGNNDVLTVTIVDNDSAPATYYSNCQGADPCNWTDAIWNTQADGMGTVIANPNDPNVNIVVQAGDLVILNVSERKVRNINVETGGTLTSIGNLTNAKFLTVFGNTILVNGTTSGALSLNVAADSTNIDGTGSASFRRIRHTGLSNGKLVFDTDVNITYSAGAALYNGISNYDFDVTISTGSTVTVPNGNVSIDGADGINGGERGGTFTIDGRLEISNGLLILYNDNDLVGIEYVVNGYLLVGGSIAGSTLETGINLPSLLTVNAGGTVEVSGAGDPFDNIDPVNNVVLFQTGSNAIYSSAMSQNVADEFEYANFESKGGGNKSLTGDVIINGVLTPTNGNIVLGLSDLILTPTASAMPGSAASYVRTNGLGVMTYQNLGAPANLFPVGNSSYNPISITNTGTPDSYSIRVLDRVPENGNSGTSLTTRIVNRTWLLTEGTTGGGNLEVRVQWNESEEAPDFVRALSYVGIYTNGEWQGGTPEPALGSDPYTQDRLGVNTSIAFAVGSSGALPVEWLHFRAQAKTNGNLLDWATAQEIANDYFSVERSADGRHFTEIGRMSGQGNRESETYYEFLDRAPLNGDNYYRLLQVDFDGSSEYSVVRRVQNTREEKPTIFPNPVHDQLTIQLGEAIDGHYTVRNGLGQLIRQGRFTADEMSLVIDTKSLIPGTYWVQLQTGEQLEQLSFQKI